MTSVDKDKTLENPVIFWSSIGVAISASFATIMKFNTVPLISTVIAGFFIGYRVFQYDRNRKK